MENVMYGYKVFNPDWTCRDYDFKTAVDSSGAATAIGSVHVFEGTVEICKSGFHFCEKLSHCFSYYRFDMENKVALVKATGFTDSKEDSKRSCRVLEVIKELSWSEVLTLANEGLNNTGHSNTGDRNTGNWNTGYSNTGNWNSANKETGFFNSKSPTTVRIFNKDCLKEVWENCVKPEFLYFDLTYWCEKEQKMKFKDYKEAFKESWEKADKVNRMLIKKLPNFDSDAFFEISGIRVEDYE